VPLAWLSGLPPASLALLPASLPAGLPGLCPIPAVDLPSAPVGLACSSGALSSPGEPARPQPGGDCVLPVIELLPRLSAGDMRGKTTLCGSASFAVCTVQHAI